MRRHIISTILFFLYTAPIKSEELHSDAYKAVVVVPIADLVGQPFGKSHNEQTYQQLPICGKSGTFACPRINQLLFHEVVTVISHQNDEVQVEVPHMFFETAQSSKKHARYWTLQKNIIPLKQIKQQDTLPQPPSFTTKKVLYDNQTIATLTQGHFDPVTRLHFSAGTRFVVAGSQQSKTVPVFVYSPRAHTMKKTMIPRNLVYISRGQTSPQEQRTIMIKTARKWAHQNQGFIPYVWGGCSFTTPCTESRFSEQHGRDIFNRQPITYYTRSHYCPGPLNGLDCTGLVIRSAQVAGMPYFFKNTTTLAKHLQPITSLNQLQAGDLIWTPGHIVIISDVENNKVIEACGYHSGYGRVHEISLNQMFKDISTFQQLITAYNNHTPLKRLNNKGAVMSTVKNFKVLSLNPIWNT